MSTQLGWGIVGTGWIANEFARGLSATNAGHVVAVASRDRQRAEAFARAYAQPNRLAPQAFDSYDEMLRDKHVDVVYVATPHVRHHADAMAALRAGKHLLCEKPFAMNASEAVEMVNLARQRKLFCMEAMWMRCMPLVIRLRDDFQGGKFGSPCTLHVEFGVPTPFDPDNRFFNPALGGGALLDRSVYAIALAQFLFGEPIEIAGHAYLGKTGVDEQTTIMLTYEKGHCLTSTCSLRAQLSNQAVLDGERGRGVLHEPFFRPAQMSFIPTPVVNASRPRSTSEMPVAAKAPSAVQRAIRSLKEASVTQKLRARCAPALKSLLATTGETHFVPIEGNGYGYEAREVARCLQAGKTESPLMQLDDTLSIMRVLDRLRQQIR